MVASKDQSWAPAVLGQAAGCRCQRHNGQQPALATLPRCHSGCSVTRHPGAVSKRLHGGGCCILKELLADDWKHLEGISSHMAGANKERSARVMRTKINFWEDGPAMERASRSPDVTAKGTGIHSHHRALMRPGPGSEWARASTRTASGLSLFGARDSGDPFHLPPHSCSEAVGVPRSGRCSDLLFLCPAERVAVWEAVAVCVQQHLLLHKVGQHPLPAGLLGGLGSPLGPGPRNAVPLLLPGKQETAPQSPREVPMGLPQVQYRSWQVVVYLRADPSCWKPLDSMRLLLPGLLCCGLEGSGRERRQAPSQFSPTCPGLHL